MDYKEALEYINGTAWYGAKPGLDRISALLERLDRPQDELKFVHIAGTNGKGSCAAMLAGIMKTCGYRTGLFTSPYLFRFNERMQVNGKQIDDEVLADIVFRVKTAACSMDDRPTAFELMTACGMLWFKEENCDIVILETGLGGSYDATNIIASPEVSVIMNIGLDHTAVLGDTVEKIAAEKAGIIKTGCGCVLYEQSESVTAVIQERCKKTASALTIPDFSQIQVEFDSLEGQVFTYKGVPYALPLLGEHQRKNASTALEAVNLLRGKGWKLEQSEVEHGLYSVNWPGRFELVSDDPCFIVDGGHNPQCAKAVADNLVNYFPGQKRVLLMGVLRDKDYQTQLDILSAVADEFICVTPPSPRALPAQDLASALNKYGKSVTVCDSIPDAVELTKERASDLGGMACAVGSLYNVGEIRACFNLY